MTVINVNVPTEGSVNSQARLPVGQFGKVFSLPATTGGKSTMFNLKFYEATGALKNFEVTSKAALTKGATDQFGSTVTSLMDAQKKREEQDSEVSRLKKQRELLEERVKIRKACAELQIECEEQ